MATKQTSFDVPDTEPWKNAETLHGLYHHDDLNQSEIAEYFAERGHDVTSSTISYWMGKLEISTTHTKHDSSSGSKRERVEESDTCAYHEVCGNPSPGPRNGLCSRCLALARRRDSDGLDCPMQGTDTLLEHIEALYDHYNS